jgi:hypothetical protein
MNETLDTPNGDTLAVFYAENIAGGANTITVSDTISATLRFAILEYSGVARSNSLDLTAGLTGPIRRRTARLPRRAGICCSGQL